VARTAEPDARRRLTRNVAFCTIGVTSRQPQKSNAERKVARSRSRWAIVGAISVAALASGWLLVARISAASIRSESAQLAILLGVLEDNCCDAILMRGVYHHVTRPVETNASLYHALPPGGRLAVVDFPPGWFLSTFFRVKGVPANRGGHGVPPDVVIAELEMAGFSLARRIDKWDGRLYCLVFQK